MHLLSSNSYSGAENVAITIIRNLSKKYEMAYVSPEGPIANLLTREGIKYIPLREMSINQVRKAVRLWKPDIIHAHDFQASIVSTFMTPQQLIISHLHHNPKWLTKLNIRSFAYLVASLRIARILCVSPVVLNEYFFSNLIKNKSLIFPNAVDCQKIIQLSQIENWTELYDIAFVGRLAEQKDPLRFINIIGKLSKRVSNIKGVIIGHGKLFEACKQKIFDMGLEQNLFMLGFKQNPFPILKNTKVLVMPSKREGYGLVAVEAMALGKPVLATPVGGLANIVNSECGGLCDSDDDFIYRLEKILSDQVYLNTLSDNAYKRARELGNIDRYINELFNIYNKLLSDK
jgi:glycosyltransferase involved in cell wall biosynthesis